MMLIAFIDLEASSLAVDGYPIEVAWVFEDGSGETHLIQPEPTWTDWSTSAEAVHGIAHSTLLREGRPAAEVAVRAAACLGQLTVFSDARHADQRWLDRLTKTAGLPRVARLRSFNEALRTAREPLWRMVAPVGSPERATSEAAYWTVAREILAAALSEELARARVRHRALEDARSLWRIWNAVRRKAEAAMHDVQ